MRFAAAGPDAGVAVCASAGVAAAVAKVTNTRKFRCLFMSTNLPFVVFFEIAKALAQIG